MKRIILMATGIMMARIALGGIICSGDSASVAIDSRMYTEPVLDSVVLPWNSSWIGGDANATVVIADNGTEVKRTTGAGEFTHSLSGGGRHELTYTTYIGGVAQSEVYATTVYAPYGIVFFDANGGSVDESSRDVAYGCAIGELPVPIRTGYTCAGWWTSANGGTRISASAIVKDNVTYYAHWTTNSYTVTFDANGGTGGTSATQNYGTTITAPTVMRTGYTFKGWSPAVAATVPDNDVTYTAQWQVNQYTVTFDANGGIGGMSITQDYGTTLVAPTVTRTGYTFTGWSPSVPATVPAENVIYTAQWRINSHMVTFDANGGTGGIRVSQNYGTAITAPTVTRTGYTFKGWSPAVAATVPDNDVTYTAQWQVNQYTATFDANGGVGGTSVTQDYGTAVAAPDVRRENYMLVGWSPAFSGTMPAENTTYVAQWLCKWICTTNADDTLKIIGVNFTPVGSVAIPSEIDGHCVKEIGPSVFSGCSGLTGVTIPDGVTSIGYSAFSGCSNLVTLTIPASVKRIGDHAFDNCPNLQYELWDGYKVLCGWLIGYTDGAASSLSNVNMLRGITSWALEGCLALEELSFSEDASLVSIGTGALKGCTELRLLVLPQSLEDIGNEAFMGCSYLDNVIVPGSVKRVGARAFKNCTGFTAAQIENGVQSLGDEAFYGDWRIAEVDIPATVTSIGANAFGGDSSIIRVSLRGDVRPISEIFSNYASIREVTVKNGSGLVIDDLFKNCSQLMDVHFFGNSPRLGFFNYAVDGAGNYILLGFSDVNGSGLYKDTQTTLTTYVERNSTGWDGTPGSHSLPQAWPLSGNYRRSIAWWDEPTYLVQFDSNGGTLGVQDTYQQSERPFVLPPEPVQTGYTFAGWWTKPLGGLRVTADTVFIEGVYTRLYAHWTKGHWVFLDPNGGTVMNDFVTYVDQTVYGVLPAAVRTGYAFGGWRYAGQTILPTTPIVTPSDHTLSAQWEAYRYSIQFDANGGTGEMADLAMVYDEAKPLAVNSFARANHDFTGWATNATGASVYADGAEVENLTAVDGGVVKLFATWKRQTVDVVIGEGAAVTPLEVGMPYGDSLSDPAGRVGYTFGGWFTEPNGGGRQVTADSIVESGVDRLYALWLTNSYMVHFDANGGDGVMSDQAFEFGKPGTLDANVFNRKYYAFTGWATNETGAAVFEDCAEVTNLTAVDGGVVTLYAAWQYNAVEVAFDVQGGTPTPENNLHELGGAYGELPEVARAGYTFGGWYTGPNGTGDRVTAQMPVRADVAKLYAHWLAHAYTVRFHANGGEGVMSDQAFEFDKAGTLDANAFTLKYFKFAGWATNATGEAIYADGAVVENLTMADGGIVELFATWTRQTVSVTVGDGVVVQLEAGTPYGDNLKDPEARAGYTFGGWFTEPDGGGRRITSESAVDPDIGRLYPYWIKDVEPEPAECPVLYAEVTGAAPLAASTYEGYLYDANGNVKGTIQVKVGKPNAKTGLAAVKATVVGMDGKKKTLKAADKGKAQIAADGPTTVPLAGGEMCEVVLGAKGMSGTYGAYAVDGALNVFTSKDAADKAVASGALGKWQGAVNVAWQDDGAARPEAAPYQTLSVTIAAKGKAKVAGTLADGTKVSAKGQLVVGEEWCCVPVAYVKKGVTLMFNVWLPLNGAAGRDAPPYPMVVGLGDAIVGKPGTLKAGATFRLGDELGDAKYEAYLPNGVPVGGGAKWTLPKAGKVQLAKDGAVDAAKLGENPSALKLTYKAKDGTFKGSFKAYSDVNGKPKGTTMKVAGVLVNGVGYGAVTVKGGSGVAVTIE